MSEEQRFSTIFEVIDRSVMPLGNITNALQGAQVATQKLTGLLNPLNMALGAIGAGLSFDKMLSIGSAFENQSIKMAQTAKLMGMGGETFADAMETAKGMIAQVNTAAAALPGEAEDYSTALEMAGFTVQQATGDYKKTFDIIKDITAITVSNQRGSAEAANQLNKMLNADRGLLELQNDYSMKLIQNMRSIPGYVNLTTASFNQMKLPERLKLVQQLSGTFKDMLDASGSTLDAIKGASMTIFKEITRQASAPLFDGWKDALSSVNALLMRADGSLTPLSQRIVFIGDLLSTKVVESVKAIGDMDFSQLGTLVGSLAALGAGGGGIAGAVLSPIVLAGATLGRLAENTDFLSSTFESFNSILVGLEPILGMMTDAFDRASLLLAGMVVGVLPAVLDAFDRIIPPILWFIGVLEQIGVQIFEALLPVFTQLWERLSTFVKGVADFVIPVVKFLGMALYGLWDIIDGPVISVFSRLIKEIGAVFEFIGKVLSFMGEQFSWALGQMGVESEPEKKRDRKSFLDDLMAAFGAPVGGSLGAAPKAPKAPDKRATTGMVQDFRYSRFEISQKFAEGYDPDRIAVSFANELAKVGEQRSQSGFAPLFSVGI